LISIAELSASEVYGLFTLAKELKTAHHPKFPGLTCAYSFEGNSLRTRAAFLKAIADLELTPVELPNLLKTGEEKRHLAGYLDQWIDVYVIRESNHAALQDFSRACCRPVVNAMTSREHPCEVLSDAFWLWEHYGGLEKLKLCIVGPSTNVLNSWVELCQVLDLAFMRVSPDGSNDANGYTKSFNLTASLEEGLNSVDVVLTDAWPEGFHDPTYQVTPEKLAHANRGAVVIPCPPFNIDNEVNQALIDSPYFVGYRQKRDLYTVQKAILAASLS
jgi:ornithine carbamoyltransferase